MQWMTPRDGTFASKSADGYYAVSYDPMRVQWRAAYKEAVWATWQAIAEPRETLVESQRDCEEHAARPRQTTETTNG